MEIKWQLSKVRRRCRHHHRFEFGHARAEFSYYCSKKKIVGISEQATASLSVVVIYYATCE